jgi:hypothetical protein
MKCPQCKGKTKVLYSYLSSKEKMRHKNRTRKCLACGYKFSTCEYIKAEMEKWRLTSWDWHDSFRRLKNYICFLYPFERDKILKQLEHWADMEKNPELKKKYGRLSSSI